MTRQSWEDRMHPDFRKIAIHKDAYGILGRQAQFPYAEMRRGVPIENVASAAIEVFAWIHERRVEDGQTMAPYLDYLEQVFDMARRGPGSMPVRTATVAEDHDPGRGRGEHDPVDEDREPGHRWDELSESERFRVEYIVGGLEVDSRMMVDISDENPITPLNRSVLQGLTRRAARTSKELGIILFGEEDD